MVTRKKLEEMFAHYIDRKRCNQAHPSDSQDGLWSAGECNEAAKWLSMFGVNLSYETVQPMIEGKSPVKMKMKGTFPDDDLAYDDLAIFVPEKKELISLCKGIGNNLFADDVAEGYVDYINYTRRDMQEGMEEIDGGMMLCELLGYK